MVMQNFFLFASHWNFSLRSMFHAILNFSLTFEPLSCVSSLLIVRRIGLFAYIPSMYFSVIPCRLIYWLLCLHLYKSSLSRSDDVCPDSTLL